MLSSGIKGQIPQVVTCATIAPFLAVWAVLRFWGFFAFRRPRFARFVRWFDVWLRLDGRATYRTFTVPVIVHDHLKIAALGDFRFFRWIVPIVIHNSKG